jgi:hypothetical protein
MQAMFRQKPPETPLALYRARFADTPGFFLDGAIATWDFFLGAQASMKTAGNIFEIGVFRGKSALLAACHMRPGEHLILNDISSVDDTVERVRALAGPQPLAVVDKSSALLARADLAPFRGTVRWFHIDGDHTGFNATNDLEVAERFLGEMGIICVDDFFHPRYPQVTAAVYRFLDRRAPLFRMVLCGERKCYLVRSADYAFWEGMVRKYLAAHLRACGFSCTVHKSTDSADMGCFSIGPREMDRDYLGLDQAHDTIPA